jgi:hypothetical protein
MNELDTKSILISILEMVKQLTIYTHRQHGWMIAVAETIAQDPARVAELKQHPFYDQGPREDVQITGNTLQSIDALIQKLRA